MTNEGAPLGLTVTLGSIGQEIVYVPITDEQHNPPRVFRIKKDLRETSVKSGERLPSDVIEETESTEISRVTVEQAVEEIRRYVPDFSGSTEPGVRGRLIGEPKV